MFDWNDLSFFLELARQGRLASAGRRLKVDHTTVSRRIAELAAEHNLLVLEDDPYGLVRYEGESLPSLFELSDGESVAYSFH